MYCQAEVLIERETGKKCLETMQECVIPQETIKSKVNKIEREKYFKEAQIQLSPGPHSLSVTFCNYICLIPER